MSNLKQDFFIIFTCRILFLKFRIKIYITSCLQLVRKLSSAKNPRILNAVCSKNSHRPSPNHIKDEGKKKRKKKRYTRYHESCFQDADLKNVKWQNLRSLKLGGVMVYIG